MKTLRPYQRKSLQIMSKDTSVLDGSEMGTGKTLVAVERVRELGLCRIPRVLVIAPVNTHRQWQASFAEQYPALADNPDMLRIISTPKTDPESWALLTKRKPGVFIIGWEAMRGSAPYSIKVITQDASDRTEAAAEVIRDAKRILRLKRPTEERKAQARADIAKATKLLKIDPHETQTIKGAVPEGWVPADKGGASRAYGEMYGTGKTLTSQAMKAAMKHGDVPPWSRTGTWDLVIADESHRLQRKSSGNKLAIKLIKADAKHASSGTASGNRQKGLWSTLNWLWPHKYRSFWDWAEQWLVIEDQRIGGDKTVQVVLGEKYPGSTWTDIPCVVRWRLESVADQLPDVIERVVDVPMGRAQREVYDEFESQALAWIDEHPVAEPLPLTQRIRLRQASLGTLRISGFKDDGKPDIDFLKTGPQPKVDVIREILEDLPEDEPMLVFTHSAKWADMAASLLDGKVGVVRSWTGALSQPKREELKMAFGKEVRVIVAVIPAIGEGVDGLQHVCRCEVWASMSDDGLLNEQAKKRLQRPGQTQKVQRWLLHSERSIDQDIDVHLRQRLAEMKVLYRDKG